METAIAVFILGMSIFINSVLACMAIAKNKKDIKEMKKEISFLNDIYYDIRKDKFNEIRKELGLPC